MAMQHKRYFLDDGGKRTSRGGSQSDPISGIVEVPREQGGKKIRKVESDINMMVDKEATSFVAIDGIASKFQQRKVHKKRKAFEFVSQHSKRAALLLPEDAGKIEADPGESTCTLTQRQICQSVDVATSSKHFSLDLQKFGPYKIDYTTSGRYLLLGGKLGHVAAFDWLTKDLLCEVNVLESVRDVKWLHNHLMYAVAQKRFTYIYDSHGTELHCLKMLNDILRLDFLPYHMLLAASSNNSFLHWVDVSLGKLVASFPTKAGALRVMRQNPANAVLHCGQSLGIVSLWSPNVKEPLMKMICHRGPVQSLDVDQTGRYMVTSGSDKMMKIWDLRTLRPLYEYKFMRNAEKVSFSQRRFLACSTSTNIQIFRDVCYDPISKPYLIHNLNDPSHDLQFCPFEDVLGVGHASGFTSLIVPGAGEPNVDVYEANPFQSKNQRREAEVKGLLDKIQPEMITLNNDLIGRLDRNHGQRVLEEKLKILYDNKLSNSRVQLKHKAKGKSGSSNVEKRKRSVRDARQKDLLNERQTIREELTEAGILSDGEKIDNQGERRRKNGSVLDRFKSKMR